MAWSLGKRNATVAVIEESSKLYSPVEGGAQDIPLDYGTHTVVCAGTFTELLNDSPAQMIALWDLSKGEQKWSTFLPFSKRALNIAGKEIKIKVEAPLRANGRKQVTLLESVSVSSSTPINPVMNTSTEVKQPTGKGKRVTA